jgi:hypothetical protein
MLQNNYFAAGVAVAGLSAAFVSSFFIWLFFLCGYFDSFLVGFIGAVVELCANNMPLNKTAETRIKVNFFIIVKSLSISFRVLI